MMIRYNPDTGIPIVPDPHSNPVFKYDDGPHKYWINGVEVPSVTTILGETTPKPALTWWGMRVGLGAVVYLVRDNKLTFGALKAQIYEEILTGIPVEGPKVYRGKRRKLKTELEAIVLDNKLDTNNIRDVAGASGDVIHNAITYMGATEELPKIDDFLPKDRPYVQAFSKWWLQQEPEFVRQEVITGNCDLAYAGRFDLEVNDQRGRGLLDFKTSGGVYPEYFEQLDLYELAEVSLGAKPYDYKGIVHLRRDGLYTLYVDTNPNLYAAECAVRLCHARRVNARHLPKGHLNYK